MPSPPRIRPRRRPPTEDSPETELTDGATLPLEPAPAVEPPLAVEPARSRKRPRGRSRGRRKHAAPAPEASSAERLKALPGAPPVLSAHRVRSAQAAKARKRAARRPAVLVGIIVIAVLSAVVAVTGLLVASSMGSNVTTLGNPLQIYPVAQSTPGQCLQGTQGITGPGPFCHQVTEGLAIHRVDSIQVEHDRTLGYEVFIKLRPGDKKTFADLTRRTLGRSLVFVVRNRLVTVSHVDTPVLGGQILITGLSGRPDADRVVRNLHGNP